MSILREAKNGAEPMTEQRGSNPTTRRFGKEIKIVATRELTSVIEARGLELMLKRNKNPRLAISALNSSDAQ